LEQIIEYLSLYCVYGNISLTYKHTQREICLCRERERERAYATQGGKGGSLHQLGFSSISLFTNPYIKNFNNSLNCIIQQYYYNNITRERERAYM
jgi:hypothetical protein